MLLMDNKLINDLIISKTGKEIHSFRNKFLALFPSNGVFVVLQDFSL